MIRLLGFLIGSAVSIGILLLILGIPDIQFARNAIENADFDAVSRTVEAAKTDVEAVAYEVKEEIAEMVNDLPIQEPPADEISTAELPKAERPTEELQTEHVVQSVNGNSDTNTGKELAEQDLRWHSFWNPFRSEIAANGFVTQLEKVTGLDYRVVKIKTGVYEVTFAYENDSERRTKLSQISSATGLDLPDS